jgi:hypothetical protein
MVVQLSVPMFEATISLLITIARKMPWRMLYARARFLAPIRILVKDRGRCSPPNPMSLQYLTDRSPLSAILAIVSIAHRRNVSVCTKVGSLATAAERFVINGAAAQASRARHESLDLLQLTIS